MLTKTGTDPHVIPARSNTVPAGLPVLQHGHNGVCVYLADLDSRRVQSPLRHP